MMEKTSLRNLANRIHNTVLMNQTYTDAQKLELVKVLLTEFIKTSPERMAYLPPILLGTWGTVGELMNCPWCVILFSRARYFSYYVPQWSRRVLPILNCSYCSYMTIWTTNNFCAVFRKQFMYKYISCINSSNTHMESIE